MDKTSNQYVITLSRLYIPSSLKIDRLILSLTAGDQQIFIQNDKNVKNNKVNFYRETIFVSDISQGISFKIYQVHLENKRKVLKIINVKKDDLKSVDKRPAMFHTKCQDYELIWECGYFNENDTQSYIQTDREYSQLNDNFSFNYSDAKELKLTSFTNVTEEQSQLQESQKLNQNAQTQTFTSINSIESCQSIIYQKDVQKLQSIKSKPILSNKHSLNLLASPRKNKKSDIYSNFMNNLTSIISNINSNK